MKEIIDNNYVELIGKFVSDFIYSHEVYGEKFYYIDFAVERLSDTTDIIPIIIPERLIDINRKWKDKNLKIVGQFRSFNKYENGKRKLILSVFAREIEESEKYEKNKIFLEGYICKEPIYRKTPLGREIADILLAVNRPYGKNDYIPCVAWGRNARYSERLKIGTKIKIYGRIQSREYRKKLSEVNYEMRVAYEVSIFKIEEVNYGKREN